MTSLTAKYKPGSKWSLSPASASAALVVLIGLACLWQLREAPIGDFGNYYYGSKLFAGGRFSLEDYSSIQHFNTQIRGYGETRFFENYTPVPPFSLLFYLPFTLVGAAAAKWIFSLASLLFLAISWFRFLSRGNQSSWWLCLIPFVAYVPLYNNLYQGQTYLLIAALLMEAYLSSEQGKFILSACCLALAISLKLFPAFLLLYFLLRRQYRLIAYSLLLSVGCYLLSGWLAGAGVLRYYSAEVLPRLFQNDIVGAYYPGNQSVYTLLLDLFSPDGLQNPQVLLSAPRLVPLLEGLFGGFLLAVLISFRKAPQALLFGLTVFISVLFSRYQTSYGLLLLLPFLGLLNDQKPKPVAMLCLALSGLACSLPVNQLGAEPLPLRYARLLCLLLVFVLYLWERKAFPALKPLVTCVLLMLGLRLLSAPDRRASYFVVQNTKGILYDYRIGKDSITLFNTLGEKDEQESVALNGMEIRPDSLLKIRGNALYYGRRKLCDGPDQKRKPMLCNDSLVLMMSDLNQGIGFYKLRCISLKP